MNIKKFKFISTIAFLSVVVNNSILSQYFHSECYTEDFSRENLDNTNAKSISQIKNIRVNIHFMLKTDGTGNFNETGDGIGGNYSCYNYANETVQWMNSRNSGNEPMNIPPNNTTQVIFKNFYYVLDAVYFHRNDATYYFETFNFSTLGTEKDSVLNIFLSYSITDGVGGYAANTNSSTSNKYTENRSYWKNYVDVKANNYPMEWFHHGTGSNTNHELCHLLGLLHTVVTYNGYQCGTGCINGPSPSFDSYGKGPINLNCGNDGCSDTPTAWEITTLNNCSVHPHGGWNTGNTAWCSNNVMDYSGANALTPCQINIIHSYLEGGMRSYNACSAVASDKYYPDLGYPRVSYFGKKITIGNVAGTLANISQNEKLAIYFSESVEFNNFEILSGADEFEVLMQATCGF